MIFYLYYMRIQCFYGCLKTTWNNDAGLVINVDESKKLVLKKFKFQKSVKTLFLFKFNFEVRFNTLSYCKPLISIRFAWIFNVRSILKIRYLRVTQISGYQAFINDQKKFWSNWQIDFSRKMRWSTPNLATSIHTFLYFQLILEPLMHFLLEY